MTRLVHDVDVLLAGYAGDVSLVAEALASFPGTIDRLHENADEQTSERLKDWAHAVVCYVFSKATGYSSQLKSLFTYLQYQLGANRQIAVLVPGVKRRDTIFPEFAAVATVSVEELGDWLREVCPAR